jgi:hypothetical protein
MAMAAASTVTAVALTLAESPAHAVPYSHVVVSDPSVLPVAPPFVPNIATLLNETSAVTGPAPIDVEDFGRTPGTVDSPTGGINLSGGTTLFGTLVPQSKDNVNSIANSFDNGGPLSTNNDTRLASQVENFVQNDGQNTATGDWADIAASAIVAGLVTLIQPGATVAAVVANTAAGGLTVGLATSLAEALRDAAKPAPEPPPLPPSGPVDGGVPGGTRVPAPDDLSGAVPTTGQFHPTAPQLAQLNSGVVQPNGGAVDGGLNAAGGTIKQLPQAPTSLTDRELSAIQSRTVGPNGPATDFSPDQAVTDMSHLALSKTAALNAAVNGPATDYLEGVAPVQQTTGIATGLLGNHGPSAA